MNHLEETFLDKWKLPIDDESSLLGSSSETLMTVDCLSERVTYVTLSSIGLKPITKFTLAIFQL